ncbi:MAG: hypothetical protein P0Y52_11375 [Candidatus Brevundimonas phytovorans]|nr:hypothetical protein [Brevundimonas sp.]WEK57137.1 MAG: hypothetical protein P0Y52_11375 [Brevundimonas sp.]
MRRIPALGVVAAAVAVAALSACVSTPVVQTADMPGQLEPVHAAAFTQDMAVFWVSSNGCTGKDDVKPFVTRLRDSAVITLRRLDEDRCQDVKPEGVQLQWSFEELGLEPGAQVSVNNPYMLRQDVKTNAAS